MNSKFLKASGIALIISAVLLVVTMVLHPSGGNIKHILQMHDIAMVAHGLAIFSLPILAFGFYGLSIALLDPTKLSLLGFIFVFFGLIGGMMAATINGLTLPLFVQQFASDFEQNQMLIKTIITYGSFINKPMDYILILGLVIGIGIWSVLMLKNALFPKGLGYFGILIILFALIGGLTKFNFTSLFGFRTFVFSIAAWIVLVGFWMSRSSKKLLP